MKINKYRKGFTLIESAIALGIASVFIAYTYSQITQGIMLKKKSEDLAKALFLTKLKMTQIESGNKITADQSSGEIPGFKGFKYQLLIKEEEIDLLKLSGMDKGKKSDSKDSESRISKFMEDRGKKQQSATGGLVKAFKIKIDIIYPSQGGPETFTTETFKSNEF